MTVATVSFRQTGMAPDKIEQFVRWVVNDDTETITIEHSADDDDWTAAGTIDAEKVAILDEPFDDDDVWKLFTYTSNGSVCRFSAKGPKVYDGEYFYVVLLEKQPDTDGFETVDDTVVDAMPEIDYDHPASSAANP